MLPKTNSKIPSWDTTFTSDRKVKDVTDLTPTTTQLEPFGMVTKA